jgi:plasmid stabilization system protein ParE
MERYEITTEAVSDLFEIWNFINRDNPEAADRVEAAVLRACERLPTLHSQVVSGKI